MGDGCDDQKTHLCRVCFVFHSVFSKEECIKKHIVRPEPDL